MKWLPLMLLLCGCASQVTLPPPQVSMSEFEAQPFPGDLYLISYKGTAQSGSERLLDLALLKASQVAQLHGHKYFVIVDTTSSSTGEVKFRTSLPAPAEWGNKLLVQGFKARPRRTFCFLAAGTEHAIYEKLRTAPEPKAL